MANPQTKKAKPKRKRKPQRQPPRRIPLILQARTIRTEDEESGKTTDEQVTVGDLIVRAVRIGAYKAQAAEAAGVSEAVLYKWINRGEDALALALERTEDEDDDYLVHVADKEKPYVEFVESLKKAEASAEVWHLNNIRGHAKKQWTASAWYLERTKRDRYGRGGAGEGSSVPTLIDLQAAVDAAKKGQ